MKKTASLLLLLTLSLFANAQYSHYGNSEDNTFLLLFFYIAFTIALTVIGSDREIGVGWSLVITLFATPVVGAVAVFASQRKRTIDFENRIIENQERIISLLDQHVKN